MSAAVKLAAVGIFCTLAALTIKKRSSEMALLLEIAACVWALFALVRLAEPVIEAVGEMRALAGVSDAVLLPAAKCAAIGVITRLASDLCRDGGQGALSGAVDTAGAVCALYAALPLVSSLLSVLEGVM